MADKQAILGSGARFTGKITNAKSIEINGFVEADLATKKLLLVLPESSLVLLNQTLLL